MSSNTPQTPRHPYILPKHEVIKLLVETNLAVDEKLTLSIDPMLPVNVHELDTMGKPKDFALTRIVQAITNVLEGMGKGGFPRVTDSVDVVPFHFWAPFRSQQREKLRSSLVRYLNYEVYAFYSGDELGVICSVHKDLEQTVYEIVRDNGYDVWLLEPGKLFLRI